MKRLFFLAATVLFCQLLFAQTRASFYNTFSGKICGHDAVLHLSYTNSYKGYVWFKDYKIPLQLMQTDTQSDSIILGTTDIINSVSLNGVFKGDVYEGTSVVIIPHLSNTELSGEFLLKPDGFYTPYLQTFVNSEATLPSKLNSDATYNGYAASIIPIDKSVLSTSVNNIIQKTFNLKSTNNIAWELKDSLTKSRKMWLNNCLAMSAEDIKMMGMSLSEEMSEDLSVMYEDEKTISLSDFIYSYTGGAHGNYSTSVYTIRKSDGKVLTVSDLFTKDGMNRLSKLLETAARKQFDVPAGPLEDNGFFVKQMPVSKEFYITKDYVGFIYNPYEIKSFAEGTINLVMPKKEISQYLKPEFK